MNDFNCIRTMLREEEIDSLTYVKLRGRFRVYWGLTESPLKRYRLTEEGLKLKKELETNFPFFDFERIIDERICANRKDKQENN